LEAGNQTRTSRPSAEPHNEWIFVDIVLGVEEDVMDVFWIGQNVEQEIA
jgi:hypothetical protein